MIIGKKELLARTMDFLPPFLWFPATRWQGLIVFNYHRVGSSENSLWDKALWSASTEAFERQVQFLKQNFDILVPRDLDDLIRGKVSRGVMITFDDGYRDNYEVAFPVLKSAGVPATFFITSGFIQDRRLPWWDEIAWMVHSSTLSVIAAGPWTTNPLALGDQQEEAIRILLKRYKTIPQTEGQPFLNWLAEAAGTGRCPQESADSLWMNWEMLREMQSAGMAFGGHTVTHPVLAYCPEDQQKFEVNTCKQVIEAELGTSLTAFSYPVGQRDSFSETTKKIVRDAGYHYAFAFYGGYARKLSADLLAIPRVAVSPTIHHSVFRSMARSPGIFAR